ncbi:cytochrome P450 [Streptomyces sp. NPDC055025]
MDPLDSFRLCPFRLDAAGADTDEETKQLRGSGPAAPAVFPGGLRAWAVLDQDLAGRLLAHPLIPRPPSAAHSPVPAAFHRPPHHPATGPDHAAGEDSGERERGRRVLADILALRALTLSTSIQETVHRLLDGLNTAARPRGTADFRAHVAQPLALHVSDLTLGVPPSMRPALHHQARVLSANGLTDQQRAGSLQHLRHTLTRLVEMKRASPGDDVTSDLTACDHTTAMAAEALADILLPVVTSHTPAVNLIHHTVGALLEHPAQLAQIRSTRATWADAVEETLRWQPPHPHTLIGSPTTDILDPGTRTLIRAHEPVVIHHTAAGRDPAAHREHPDIYDISRSHRGHTDHVSFGAGPRLCPGADLARVQALTATADLFTRFPDVTLAHPSASRTPARLSLRLRPGGTPAAA